MSIAAPLLCADHVYYPHEITPKYWTLPHFRFDQPKLNLLWLVEPEVDSVWNSPWAESNAAVDIDKHMSLDIRAALNLPPLEFVKWWKNEDCDSAVIAERFPTNYMQTMTERATLAHRRIFDVRATVLHFRTKSG